MITKDEAIRRAVEKGKDADDRCGCVSIFASDTTVRVRWGTCSIECSCYHDCKMQVTAPSPGPEAQ